MHPFGTYHASLCTCVEVVQFYCPSHTYLAIIYCTIFPFLSLYYLQGILQGYVSELRCMIQFWGLRHNRGQDIVLHVVFSLSWEGREKTTKNIENEEISFEIIPIKMSRCENYCKQKMSSFEMCFFQDASLAQTWNFFRI